MYKRVTKKKFVRFQSLWKLHNKVSYGASGFCANYTTKTPLYIYYIISQSANAACIILAFWYYVIVPMRRERQRKGGRNDKRMNRTRSETREAGSIADGAQRGSTGRKIHCKGDEQTEICFQVRYCWRGDCRRASAIRAHKVKRRPSP